MKRLIPFSAIVGVWIFALGRLAVFGATAASDVTASTPAAVAGPATVPELSNNPTVADQRLVGTWQGRDRFFGLSHEEITSGSVEAQDVEVALAIAADGTVTGRIGGATLRECTLSMNRGAIGRLLHVKTDFIIDGKLVGAVVPQSEGGTHVVRAPMNLEGRRLIGSCFVMRGGFSNPYPFLKLRLDRRAATGTDAGGG